LRKVAASVGTAPSGRLADAWRAKWLHYFPIYERELAPLAGTGPRILEIGVAGGGSLGMWRSYLGGGSTVVGIDIDPACARFEDCDRGIHVRVGSQADPQFLQRVVAELGPFDAIIDDGSHVVSHMIAAFGALFFAGLRAGGVYIVEDTHAAYWQSHRDLPHTFTDFIAALIDMQHAAYWTASSTRQFDADNPDRLRSVAMPRLAALIDTVTSHDSVSVIRRRQRPPTLTVTVRNDR
jgi:hypothetical protein